MSSNAISIPHHELINSIQAIKKLTTLGQLNVKYDQTPHHNVHEFDAFMAHLACYPEFSQEQIYKPLSSMGYVYNPSKLLTSSNVSYEIVEHKASKHKELKSAKKNTYIMCPICDPFEKLKDHTLKETLKKFTSGGEECQKSSKSPTNTFYSTLSSSYVHHMAQCHGVIGEELAQQPIVGFVGPKMTLSAICPYVNQSGQPCLQISPYNFKAGNGFKAYFRHVAESHHGTSTKSFVTYNKVHVFVPLYVDELQKVTKGMASKWLRLQNSDMARSIISKIAGYDPVFESSPLSQTAFKQHVSCVPVSELSSMEASSHQRSALLIESESSEDAYAPATSLSSSGSFNYAQGSVKPSEDVSPLEHFAHFTPVNTGAMEYMGLMGAAEPTSPIMSDKTANAIDDLILGNKYQLYHSSNIPFPNFNQDDFEDQYSSLFGSSPDEFQQLVDAVYGSQPMP